VQEKRCGKVRKANQQTWKGKRAPKGLGARITARVVWQLPTLVTKLRPNHHATGTSVRRKGA